MEYGEVLRSIKQIEQEQANLNARMMEGKASNQKIEAYRSLIRVAQTYRDVLIQLGEYEKAEEIILCRWAKLCGNMALQVWIKQGSIF